LHNNPLFLTKKILTRKYFPSNILLYAWCFPVTILVKRILPIKTKKKAEIRKSNLCFSQTNQYSD